MAKKKSTPEEAPVTCVPPKSFERNEFGLLCDPNVTYEYSEDGFIDWRKMVSSEYLVANRQRTKETDISKLEDRDLLILLAGIKDLAKIRGYESVEYSTTCPSPDIVVAICKISFIPNYETEGKAVVFSAIGDATINNTHGFGSMYLAACAENRAFVRCVRNFLRINVVAFDEINHGAGQSQLPNEYEQRISPDASLQLKELMLKKGVSIEALKRRLVEENYDGADSIADVSDLPAKKIFELIGRLKKIQKS